MKDTVIFLIVFLMICALAYAWMQNRKKSGKSLGPWVTIALGTAAIILYLVSVFL